MAELERLEREEASLLQSSYADETDVEALGAAVDEDGNDDGRQVDTCLRCSASRHRVEDRARAAAHELQAVRRAGRISHDHGYACCFEHASSLAP